MSLDYVRRAYKVPAKRGGRVRVETIGEGTIMSATALLKIRFDNGRISMCHPTWMIEYLDAAPLPTVEGEEHNV